MRSLLPIVEPLKGGASAAAITATADQAAVNQATADQLRIDQATSDRLRIDQAAVASAAAANAEV